MILSDIAVLYDCPHSTAPDEGEGYPLIRTPNVGKGRLILDGVHRVSREVYDLRNKRAIPQENDIIFAREAPAGNAAVIVKDQFVCLGQRTVLIRPNPQMVDSHYLTYYLLAPQQQTKLLGYSHGATVGHVNIPDLAKLPVVLPELSKQKAIAGIIELYDNLIETNNKRIKVLEQMAKNLYKEWFVRFRFPGHESTSFETGIPKDWEIKKVKDIVKRLPFGRLYKTEDTETEGKVIVIDQSQDEYVGFHNDAPSHVATKDSPIVLFGDHSCKQQLMTRPFSLSENVVPFVGKEGILTTYLYYLIHRIVETTEYKRHWSEFVAKKVVIAPVELQRQYVETVNPWIALIQYYSDQNRKLIKQRDLLLPRLMSGKLEV